MQDSIAYHLPPLLKASWQGGVLILLVLAVQWAFGRRLSPRWRHALWLLVLIRLALPSTIPSPVSLFNLLNFSPAPVSLSRENATPSAPNMAAQSTPVVHMEFPEASSALQHAASWQSGLSFLLLPWLWLSGASALAIYLLITHLRFSKRIVNRRPLIDEAVLNLLEDCKQQMGVRVPITLVETGDVGSPALFGFVRPRLLLPVGLTRSFSLEELRYVFLHELGHIKRHDILVGWLMMGLQILHWFNPLVWLAFHRMRVDRELACDALALSFTRENENQPYGDTIIKLLERFGRSAWAPSLAGTAENKNQLQERIAMIATFKKTNKGLVLALVLGTGLGLVTLTDAKTVTSQLGKDLIGTWVCVGTPGDVGAAPAVGGRLKTLTNTHWSLTQANPETGAIIFRHGGTWTLNGDEYSETVDYANHNTAELVHHTFKFSLKLDGDTLTLIGVGNPWKEVWKRVKSDAAKPNKLDSVPQGKWREQEPGKASGGVATLTLQGSNLEFHGADANEWYKAKFTVYDTTPKQIVMVIKECAVPQYVGRTSYAIYQLQNGTLTITGNEPGNPFVPAGFDAPGSRKLVFKQE